MTQQNKYGTFFVYALADPDNERIFYVGRTKDVKQRVKRHMKDAESYEEIEQNTSADLSIKKNRKKYMKHISNRGKLKWINNITKKGKEPKVIILDSWNAPTEADANRLEDAWIAIMLTRDEPLQNYIYSRRQYPDWYSPHSRNWKPGYAKSPQEFIERLKKNELTPAKHNKRRRFRRRKRKYNKRS